MTEPSLNTATPNEAAIEEIGPPPRSYRNQLLRIASFLTVMIAWELLGRQVAPLFMSYPSAIAAAAVTMTVDGELSRPCSSAWRRSSLPLRFPRFSE